MILPLLESAIFYRILWALLDYANERLQVVESMTDAAGENDLDLARQVADQMWEHREVIDDFVRENPACLTKLDLGVAGLWKHALRGSFVALRDDVEGTVFLAGKHAIRVCGPTEEVSSMLPYMPTYVEGTLLPFGDYVVSCVWVLSYDVALGPGIRSQIEADYKDAVAAGRMVRTGDELIAAMPAIESAIDKSRNGREEFEARVKAQKRTRQPGTHRSLIAGFAPDVRQEMVSRELARRLHEKDGRTPASVLASRCTASVPLASLAKTLEAMKKVDLQRLARNYDLKGTSSLNKAQLSQRIADALADPEMLEVQLSIAVPRQLRHVREVFEHGGRMVMDAIDVVDLRETPMPAPPFLHGFYHDDTFSFVVPDELMQPMASFDWDEIERVSRTYEIAEKFVGMSAELRGMVDIEELYPSYERVVPEDLRLPENDFFMVVLGGIAAGYDGPCDFVELDGDVYATDLDITDWYPPDGDQLRDPDAPITLADQALARFARGLFRARDAKPARDVPLEVLDEDSLSEWLVMRPAVVALRDFLDDNVPDGLDDYLFADNTAFELANMVLRDYQPTELLTYINEQGYTPDEARLTQLLELIMGMCNGLPHWYNNGWSPDEIVEQGIMPAGRGGLDAEARAREVFGMSVDSAPVATASSTKVGRNDPCPCGSGKKYKKCCGKNS